MNCHRIGSLISEFGALERGEVLSRLVQRIVQLPPTPKKVLAMYYYENLQLAEIADCLGLAEREIDQIRPKTLWAIETMLVAHLTRTQLPNRQAAARPDS
jgi:DNA-directed RNA polymerase specialized sigma subunit